MHPCHSAIAVKQDLEGPSTQIVGLQVPKSILWMVFGDWNPTIWVLGPSQRSFRANLAQFVGLLLVLRRSQENCMVALAPNEASKGFTWGCKFSVMTQTTMRFRHSSYVPEDFFPSCNNYCRYWIHHTCYGCEPSIMRMECQNEGLGPEGLCTPAQKS